MQQEIVAHVGFPPLERAKLAFHKQIRHHDSDYIIAQLPVPPNYAQQLPLRLQITRHIFCRRVPLMSRRRAHSSCLHAPYTHTQHLNKMPTCHRI
ncbi:hypothetical protein AYI69_g13 [Smittium culicis]|uniref:Uncharacterized protein n=1 Tax=Smittium culicis TaxID=133412 RepID=A0A1R1YU73_9FUNG|nr:hypothetical protein AYI69_g13 [Smittium culicis]